MPHDVSIIIAAFNAANTIERALASALATEGVSFEVIVADDASRDETIARVVQMADPRIRLLRSEVNRGPGGARNSAIAEARGRYVSVLDADDTMHADRLARLVARLDASGIDIVVDGVEVRDAWGQCTPVEGLSTLPAGFEIDLPFYLRQNVLFKSAYNLGYLKPTIRRSALIDRHIAYGNLRIGEDFLLIAELLAGDARCAVEPIVGYTYNVTDGSISRILERHHVIAMREADERFRAQRVLDRPVLEALDERRRAFDNAYAFLTMIEALKKRDLRSFATQACACPSALHLFKMPLMKRLGKMARVFRPSRQATP